MIAYNAMRNTEILLIEQVAIKLIKKTKISSYNNTRCFKSNVTQTLSSIFSSRNDSSNKVSTSVWTNSYYLHLGVKEIIKSCNMTFCRGRSNLLII